MRYLEYYLDAIAWRTKVTIVPYYLSLPETEDYSQELHGEPTCPDCGKNFADFADNEDCSKCDRMSFPRKKEKDDEI